MIAIIEQKRKTINPPIVSVLTRRSYAHSVTGRQYTRRQSQWKDT